MKYALKLIAWIKKKIVRCDLFGHTSLARELASGCSRNWCAKLPRTAVGCACRNTVAGSPCSCGGSYYHPLFKSWGWNEPAPTSAPVQDEAVQVILGMNQKHILFPYPGIFQPLFQPQNFPLLPTPFLFLVFFVVVFLCVLSSMSLRRRR